MLGTRLDKKTESRLQRLSKTTGRSKSFYAKRAIQDFLDEQEDYLLAIARLEDETNDTLTLKEMRRRLGLDASV